MRKHIVFILSLLLFFMSHVKSNAQFPYQSTLISENDFTQFSSSKVTFDKYGATLTPATGSTTRGFYLNDLAFTVDRGFIIEFDYLMTGGSGFADGLALVLFDGVVTSPKMGSDGSGLGYSYKTPGSSSNVGLTKGFLAVGVDLWGAFKYRRDVGNEYRNGIRKGVSNSTLENGDPEAKNHITIRGQAGPNDQAGYPVLISQSTTNMESRTMLNFTNGLYDTKPQAPQDTPFSFKLRENTQGNENDIDASFGHDSYRRVEISMLPGKKGNNVDGYYMSVYIVHKNERSRVINDYFLPNNVEINYMEAIGSSESSNQLRSMVMKAPKTFKIGFAASTGGYNQKHIVRNLSLYMPFSPSVKDLFVDNVCRDVPIELDVLANSVGFDNNKYNGQGDIHLLGKEEFLDTYSFQFRTLVNGLYEDTAQPYIAVTDNGTYEYNPVTHKMIFVPKKGGVTVNFDQVYFTIRNKEKILENNVNLGSEQFRSNTATVRLNFGYKCNDVLMVNGNSI
ncbi:hypothetical protein LNQ81_13410 [Myroides sp. M-43]|uniref:hypothetical protein n=1 Tax=Myroides oncorhynchi TaxID=2893756 RepID=UPI001E36EC7E|nr:hypothetical protein [Myroides oncorhynchi]MCC9043670.1 hypothetical protein [Myroides oncorhynchi]